MTDAITRESQRLYTESSQLRAMARMLKGNGDTERPDVAFAACELDGLSSLLATTANNIDAVRDRLPGFFEKEER